MTKLARLLVIACLPYFFLPVATPAQEVQSDPDRNPEPPVITCGLIDELQALESLNIAGQNVAALYLLEELYRRNDYQLLWHNRQNISELILLINESYNEGLTPADYHAGILTEWLGEFLSEAMDSCKREAFDILLSDSLTRLSYHFSYGKVNPESLDPNWNLGQPLITEDPVSTIESAINADSLVTYLLPLLPRDPLYTGLRSALAQYRGIKAIGGWPQLPAGPTLKPGMSDPRVIPLRQRLFVTGDLTEYAGDPQLYDDNVTEAVKSFQARHQLDIDGKVGKKTRQAMNIDIDARINQIRANMERMRWIFRNPPADFLIVDIAGFRAAMTIDGEIIWSSAVQVGKPYRKTPVFRGELSYLVFNPTWTVPPTIFKEDVLPQIKQDPSYLTQKNMIVIDRYGVEIDPATIDWEQTTHRNFPYMIRQVPGTTNALGRIKFMFPNKHAIYLHDTPNKSGFDKTRRTFSSGCIRVQKPLELAEVLLNDRERWNADSMQQIFDTQETLNVPLKVRFPIFILYWTVTAEDGTVYFRPDVYERDQPLIEALDGACTFSMPQSMPAPYRNATKKHGDNTTQTPSL